MKAKELEEELDVKTDQLLRAFEGKNKLEVEIASVKEDQQASLGNAAKLESNVC